MKMTLTKDEFIELYRNYKDRMDQFKRYEGILDESLIDMWIEPYSIIFQAIGIEDRENDFYLLSDFYFDGKYPICWEIDENGYAINIKYSHDLGELYDHYVKQN